MKGWLVGLILNVPVNNFSVMLGRSHHFRGITSTSGSKCTLLKDTTRFDPSGARTKILAAVGNIMKGFMKWFMTFSQGFLINSSRNDLFQEKNTPGDMQFKFTQGLI